MKTMTDTALLETLKTSPLSDFVKECLELIIKDTPSADEQPEILYKATIPLQPRSKKNNQQIVYDRKSHKQKLIQGEIYRQYEKDCGWFLKPVTKPITDRVNIECVFYRDNLKRCDLTNLLEAIDDILVHYKIIADDNFQILAAHDGSRVYLDRINPRTEITITRYRGRS